jgi:hypothetical protein
VPSDYARVTLFLLFTRRILSERRILAFMLARYCKHGDTLGVDWATVQTKNIVGDGHSASGLPPAPGRPVPGLVCCALSLWAGHRGRQLITDRERRVGSRKAHARSTERLRALLGCIPSVRIMWKSMATLDSMGSFRQQD